jgi:hypothetical protein
MADRERKMQTTVADAGFLPRCNGQPKKHSSFRPANETGS